MAHGAGFSKAGSATPTLIKQRYEVLETLEAGGEGRVVKAPDRQHGRLVALKIRRAGSDRAREELLSEARILLAISPHPALPLVREDFFDGKRPLADPVRLKRI